MQLYRAVQNLAWGNRTVARGTVFDGARLKAVERLVRVGAIAPVSTPPLEMVPGWQRRAVKLRTLGKTSVEEVLSMPAADLAGVFGVRPETAERWQSELLAQFAELPGEVRG
jgi:hypothetical protein